MITDKEDIELRFLHLEDEPTDAEIIEHEIRKEFKNCVVLVVEKEADFISGLDNFKPDIVLADYKLPSFNGLEAIKIVLDKSPLIPVILITGPMNEDTAVDCMKAGATDYIIKGNIKRLVPAIETALEQRKIKIEKIRAEKILKESEERFRALVSASSEVQYRMSPDWSEMHQLQSKGFLANTERPNRNWLTEYIPPEERQLVTEAINESIRTKKVFELEHRVFRADGSMGWTFSRAVPLVNGNGEIFEWFGSASDITTRKQVQEALRDSEEKFRTLFENITAGVAIHEIVYENSNPVNYRIIDFNPAFERICGIGTKAAIGTLATDLYGTSDPPYFKKFLEVANTQKPYRFETFFKGMNKYFIIDVISPKKGQFATVFEDITEQKVTEYEIKHKNEELSRFIYTVSHDLKSPLVTVKTFSNYLQEDIEKQNKEAIATDIGYINNAADKMGKLLDELLELSRIGKKEAPKEEIPMKTLAQSAIDLLAGRIAQGKVNLSITGPDVMLFGHQLRLLQLYQNLIDNSVKFMGNQSEPFIEIGSSFDSSKNQVVLFVRDNGSGIDPKYHDRVFGLFEKLNSKTEGAGIGLALIKRIVEVHGGEICFSSEGEGKGTTFYFTLEGTYILQNKKRA